MYLKNICVIDSSVCCLTVSQNSNGHNMFGLQVNRSVLLKLIKRYSLL